MHIISSKPLSLSRLKTLTLEGSSIELSDELIQKIQNCRDYLDQKIEASSDPIYGINTGFGALCDVRIHSENLTKLQENLVRFSCMWHWRACSKTHHKTDAFVKD